MTWDLLVIKCCTNRILKKKCYHVVQYIIYVLIDKQGLNKNLRELRPISYLSFYDVQKKI
jgi:hypothetical protein